ncbi:MAG: HNH endonuclease, partial [Planctomycetota bacterium]
MPVLWYRRIRYGCAFRRIPLTRGKYAIVDPDDYWHLSKHKWHANGRNGNFYAVRTVFTEDGKRHLLSMHRHVLKVPPNTFVDHINRNSLDNRKANLRPATRAQNGQNRTKFNNRTYTSKYKGVTWNSELKHWQAQIQVNHKLTFLGRFGDEVDAAKAYDRAAKKYHRQFAVLNFSHRRPGLLRSLLTFQISTYFSSWFASLNFPHPASSIEYLLTSPPAIRKVAAMAKKLYIIDGHAHIYAAYYARMRQKLTSPSGEPTNATYIFTMAIIGLIQRHNPDMLVVAMDSKAPTFRSEIYDQYKANRPPMPDDMPAQIDRIEQILEAMNIPTLRLDGFEADDIIGTLAKKASKDGIDTYICARDKDMYQLVDDHTYIFDIKKGEVLDDDALFEKYKIHPKDF